MTDRRLLESGWKRVAFAASALIFVVAVIGCAERDWHMPHIGVLVPLYVVGILSGVGINVLRARSLAPSPDIDNPITGEAIVNVTSTGQTTHALAAIIGAITSIATGILLGLTAGSSNELVTVSLVGALYMATWPLQVLAARLR